MPPYPAFVGGSYVAQSPVADMEKTVNFYVEQLEVQGGKARSALYPTPGVRTISTAPAAPGRAHFAQDGREFTVVGSKFNEVDEDGSITEWGEVQADEFPATICTNGDGGGQLFITSGNNGYIFDLNANTLTQVRTGATRMGAHLDGYFLALDTATSTLYLSDLLDGTTWDPTQFAQRSIQPDPWISMKVIDRYVWLFGTETSEVWYNAGAFPFPFQPHPSGLVQHGCAAAFSPEIVDGALMWLSATADGDGQVVRTAGFSPDVVSTFPLQVALAALANRSDGIGDTYQDLGHTFYILTFPTDGKTVAYDATTGIWCDRGTWIAEENRFDAWRPLFHVFVFGQHRILDRQTGDLYHLSSSHGVDVDDRPIRRVRVAPGIWKENQRITYPSFELHLEAGLGLTSGQGSDPLVAMRASNDGGKVWGNERHRSAGAIGKYQTRLVWNRCGQARHRVFEVVMSDPIPWRITGASLPDLRLERGAA